ncbi:biopolymer transporter ExbD [Methylocaldum sp.]|uniref:ExbD/TolR family protein n=1 Tax=Methylocaldum sp. TaxID=1969727 RepID=UPI002D292DEC|nr:biopolymer transporter ExbD [Methylocaldum sp.]HYE37906.1 biopolymer transporter ExbD [Methylocaldum sp.]
MGFKTDSSSDREAMSEINVTPLVDVMLVLLVVFIVTAPLLTQAVKVDLPKTEKTDPSPDKHLATIAIDAQGQITLNDQPQPLEALEQLLRDLLQADPELIVQFQADTAVAYGRVAETMAVTHKAGITKLAFITRE